jgi:predicted PurR-regulated permease PerM
VATVLVFFGVVAALALLAATLVRPVIDQSEALVSNLPAYTEQLSRPGTWAGDIVNRYDLIERIQASQAELVSRLTNFSGTFVGVVFGVFSSLVAFISIFALTFFMMLEGPVWLGMLWEVLPPGNRKHAKKLAEEMYQAMVGYVNGKILAAFLAGVSAAIALIVLHIPYVAALSLVVAILSIIPVFGATIGAVIACAVALFTSPVAALILAIFFFVYQQFENNVIQPVIFKHALDVSPLLVFVSVLIGTALGGILGALIAIPITASIQILVRDYYGRRVASERVPVKKAAASSE